MPDIDDATVQEALSRGPVVIGERHADRDARDAVIRLIHARHIQVLLIEAVIDDSQREALAADLMEGFQPSPMHLLGLANYASRDTLLEVIEAARAVGIRLIFADKSVGTAIGPTSAEGMAIRNTKMAGLMKAEIDARGGNGTKVALLCGSSHNAGLKTLPGPSGATFFEYAPPED